MDQNFKEKKLNMGIEKDKKMTHNKDVVVEWFAAMNARHASRWHGSLCC